MSLIGFSNWAFYEGRLLTVPEDQLAAAGCGQTIADEDADGDANVARSSTGP